MSANNPTEKRNSVNSRQAERPQFRGTFAPADLHHLLYDGKITTTEFVLLQIVDSLVNSRGLGCWASNEYLAKRCGVKVRQLQSMVSHLIGIGALKRTGWHELHGTKFRLLETSWSRIIPQVDGCTDAVNCTQGDAVECTQRNTIGKKGGEAAPPAPPENSGLLGNSSPQNVKKSSAPPTKEEKQALQWVDQLRATLRSHKKQVHDTTNSNRSTQAARFLKLWKDIGKDTALVQNVLDWWCANFPEKPEVHSANQFCNCFHWLEGLMNKDSPPPAKEIELSEQAQKTLAMLANLTWPQGEEQLPAVVQQSVDNYLALCDRATRLEKKLRKGTSGHSQRDAQRLQGFLLHAGQHLFMFAPVFLLDWFTHLNHRYHDWEDWDGDMERDIFTTKHKHFRQILGKQIANYGDTELWPLLKESLL